MPSSDISTLSAGASLSSQQHAPAADEQTRSPFQSALRAVRSAPLLDRMPTRDQQHTRRGVKAAAGGNPFFGQGGPSLERWGLSGGAISRRARRGDQTFMVTAREYARPSSRETTDGADYAAPPSLGLIPARNAPNTGSGIEIVSEGNPFFRQGGIPSDRYKLSGGSAARRARTANLKANAALRAFEAAHPRNAIDASLPHRMDAAEQHVAQYGELLYLANRSVSATNEAAGGPVPADSYSAGLGMAHHFVEFERSLLSLRCLTQIIDGSIESHENWMHVQREPKLGYSSFVSLADQWYALVKHYVAQGIHPDELRRAAEVALVLGDMGKAKTVKNKMAQFGINDADHDDFYGHVMREPRALAELPSFQTLTPRMQALVRATANLAHFGHITHCEGGPQMFSTLKASGILNEDPQAFEFAALVHMCDVAGALGHVNPTGSITFNQATFDAIKATFDACRCLKDTDEVGAYEALLATRATWLGLSPLREEDRMLARLGAMTRLTTKAQGEALKKGFSALSEAERESALRYLGVVGAGELPRTPTYMPAVLVNLMNSEALGESPEQRLAEAIRIGVPFITSTLGAYAELLRQQKMPRHIPLNFNLIAGIAKRTPWLLETPEAITISPETGDVTI